jgi:SsrA-binding protein
MAKKKNDNLSPRIANRKALHDYFITEKLEVGIVLSGSEVKSIRNSQVSLAEGYARVDPDSLELYLHNVDIALYPHAGVNQHTPKAPRKLLAHKREIEKLLGATTVKGTTLVPLAMYFKNGRVKVEVGVGVGKKTFDKRQAIKKKSADREIRRGMTRKVL